MLAIAIALPLYAVTSYDGTVAVSAGRWFATPLLAIECVVIMLCFAAGWNPLATISTLPRYARAGLALWLFGASLSSTLAARPEAAWLMQGMWILHGVFAIALCSHLAGPWREARMALVAALGLGLLLFSATVYGVAALRGSDLGTPWEAFSVGVVNPRHYVFYAAPLLGLAVAFLATARGRGATLVAAVAVFSAYHLLAWSGGRNAMGVALLFPLAFTLIVRCRWRMVLVTCFASALIAYPLTLVTAPDRPIYGFGAISQKISGKAYAQAAGPADYSSGRTALWATSLEMIAERPVTGHGQSQFDLVLERSGVEHHAVPVSHPHNAALQFLYDWGILGTGGLVLMAVPFLLGLPRRLQTAPGATIPACAALLALAMTCALDGTLFFNAPLFLTATLLAVLASAPDRRNADGETGPETV